MDNVYIPEQEVGIWQWIFGKTVTSIVLLNSGSSDGFVGVAAPSLARILPVGQLDYDILFLSFIWKNLQLLLIMELFSPLCYRLISQYLVENFDAR